MKNKATKILASVKAQISEKADKYHVADAVQKTWNSGVVAASDISNSIAGTEWFRSLNSLSNEVTKAMDSDWLKNGISGGMFPSNHRVLDGGHTIGEALSRAFEVGEKNGWSDIQSFSEGTRAYFSDLSSPAGMPMLGQLTDDIYEMLRGFGIKEELARDLVTINGQEAIETVLGGTIASVSLVLAWSKEDKEQFSQVLAAVGLTSAIALNPLALAAVVVMLALNYNTLVCKKAMVRGVTITGIGVAVSALAPGPIWVGLIPAIVATIYARKVITPDIDVLEVLAGLKKKETRDQLVAALKRLNDDIINLVPKRSESTT
jgi:hypothetical protein